LRKSRAKTNIKAVKLALQENDIERAKELLPLAMKELHIASSRGALHRNNSSRKISRLASLVHKYESQAKED
jgi:small subunit ribosomal protein S20